MTWTKTPDDYPERMMVLELSDAAYRLHHAATTYANRVGLDGRIPKRHAPMIAVPPKARRINVIRELLAAGLWSDAGDTWVLADFFDAQLSSEEVKFEREYGAIRQRIRFAKTPETLALLRSEEDAIKSDLNAARERRRARASQRESQRHSQRPVPFRPVPSRSNEDEDEDGSMAGPRGATHPDDGRCFACGIALLPDEAIATHREGSRLLVAHATRDACRAARAKDATLEVVAR